MPTIQESLQQVIIQAYWRSQSVVVVAPAAFLLARSLVLERLLDLILLVRAVLAVVLVMSR
jgi:hypothetical protein